VYIQSLQGGMKDEKINLNRDQVRLSDKLDKTGGKTAHQQEKQDQASEHSV